MGFNDLFFLSLAMDFNKIIQQFFPGKIIKDINAFGNGHINSTFKLTIENESQEYILQRINKNVFKYPQNIIHNHQLIQKIFNNSEISIPELVPTKNNSYLFVDYNNDTWKVSLFIENSYSVEHVESETQAFEAGKAFGHFVKLCSQLNPNDFRESIKDFHKLSFRINQLNNAVKADSFNRADSVVELIEFYKSRGKSLLEIELLIQNNEIPIRVVHNDTKINNLLFRNEKAIAVIDLDTVGQGSIFYDYGDAVRTIANTADEDEKNIELVEFNMNYFKAFTKSYLQQTSSMLNSKEKELLHIAPILMTYIMGIRFLTDYLNGDIYFKTDYDGHNLIRSLVQERLIEIMEQKSDEIKTIVTGFMQNINEVQ